MWAKLGEFDYGPDQDVGPVEYRDMVEFDDGQYTG